MLKKRGHINGTKIMMVQIPSMPSKTMLVLKPPMWLRDGIASVFLACAIYPQTPMQVSEFSPSVKSVIKIR